MSYYSRNPHDDAGAGFYREQTERRERAEEVAGDWFAYATRPQTAAFHQAMSDLRGLDAPRYDRARDAAKAAFERDTAEAAALCNETITDWLANGGEVSEELAERWEELAARTNAAAIPYEEALQDAEKARALFDASKGGNVRGITEDRRYQLAKVINAAHLQAAE